MRPKTLPTTSESRRPTVADVQRMSDLIDAFARQGEMLPRAPGELFETLRDFFVVRHERRRRRLRRACTSPGTTWRKCARWPCMRTARRGASARCSCAPASAKRATLGLKRVFALTMKPAFFEKLGFAQADAMTLSRKVWNECYRCPKFMSCDETAMVIDV